MFKTEVKKNPETDRYYGEVVWGEWSVFRCPAEYDREDAARLEADRQFAGTLRHWLAQPVSY